MNKTMVVYSRGLLSDESVSLCPKDLIFFSDEYKDHRRKELIPFLKSKKGEVVSLLISRIEQSGHFGKREISGMVKEVTDEVMILLSCQDYYGDYTEEQELLLSFWSPFETIPMLVSFSKHDPFSFFNKENNYSRRLEVMIKTMESVSKKKHNVKLFFGWDESSHPNFNKGNFFVEGEIIKVNSLGVEIKSSKSAFSRNGIEVIANEIPGNYFWRFVSPDCYLKRILSFVEEDSEDI